MKLQEKNWNKLQQKEEVCITSGDGGEGRQKRLSSFTSGYDWGQSRNDHYNITLNGLHLATTTRHLVNCTKIDCLAIIMSNFLHFQLLEMERTSQNFNKN